MTITGSGFQAPQIGNPNWSFAVWSARSGESDLLTRYVSDTQLTAIIPEKLLKDPAAAEVRVVNGDPMGWFDGYRGYPKSNALSFAIVVTTASNTAVAGKWVGTFDTSDPADCHTNTPASATFDQDGDRVHDVLSAVTRVDYRGLFSLASLKLES
jgi:hypothetical protein